MAPNTYTLSCNDCSFETTIEANSYDVIGVADAHQEKVGETAEDHFVTFVLTSESREQGSAPSVR